MEAVQVALWVLVVIISWRVCRAQLAKSSNRQATIKSAYTLPLGIVAILVPISKCAPDEEYPSFFELHSPAEALISIVSSIVILYGLIAIGVSIAVIRDQAP